jgi:hypothetical protein
MAGTPAARTPDFPPPPEAAVHIVFDFLAAQPFTARLFFNEVSHSIATVSQIVNRIGFSLLFNVLLRVCAIFHVQKFKF